MKTGAFNTPFGTTKLNTKRSLGGLKVPKVKGGKKKALHSLFQASPNQMRKMKLY